MGEDGVGGRLRNSVAMEHDGVPPLSKGRDRMSRSAASTVSAVSRIAKSSWRTMRDKVRTTRGRGAATLVFA